MAGDQHNIMNQSSKSKKHDKNIDKSNKKVEKIDQKQLAMKVDELFALVKNVNSKQENQEQTTQSSKLSKRKLKDSNRDSNSSKSEIITSQLGDMDSLFSDAMEKVKEAKAKAAADAAKTSAKRQAKIEKMKQSRTEFKCNDIAPVRFDAELGMPIYKAEDLRIGQGGGTKDCPFDCNCCF